MTHTTLITSPLVNIHTRPDVDSDLITENMEYSIGDLHANAMKLMYFLVRQGIVSITEDSYIELANIYDRNNWEKETINRFNWIIDNLTINQGPLPLIRLIGDELADRGSNDWFILKILEKLHQNNVPMEILLSNHSVEFLMPYENGNNFISPRIRAQSGSMTAMHNLIGDSISRDQINNIVDDCYIPKLKLISYAIQDNEITLFSHAAIDLQTIQSLANKFEITYNDDSLPALKETIDSINKHFLEAVKGKKVNEMLKNMFTEVSRQQNNENYDYSKKEPLVFTIWNRGYNILNRVATKNDFSLLYAHGHDDGPGYVPEHILNTNSGLGKGKNTHKGDLIFLATRVDPVLQKQHEQVISSSSSSAPTEVILPLPDEQVASPASSSSPFIITPPLPEYLEQSTQNTSTAVVEQYADKSQETPQKIVDNLSLNESKMIFVKPKPIFGNVLFTLNQDPQQLIDWINNFVEPYHKYDFAKQQAFAKNGDNAWSRYQNDILNAIYDNGDSVMYLRSDIDILWDAKEALVEAIAQGLHKGDTLYLSPSLHKEFTECLKKYNDYEKQLAIDKINTPSVSPDVRTESSSSSSSSSALNEGPPTFDYDDDEFAEPKRPEEDSEEAKYRKIDHYKYIAATDSSTTALHLAAKDRNEVAIKHFIQEGADVNKLDSDNKNPLTIVMIDFTIQFIELERKNNPKDSDIIQKKYMELAIPLLRAGAIYSFSETNDAWVKIMSHYLASSSKYSSAISAFFSDKILVSDDSHKRLSAKLISLLLPNNNQSDLTTISLYLDEIIILSTNKTIQSIIETALSEAYRQNDLAMQTKLNSMLKFILQHAYANNLAVNNLQSILYRTTVSNCLGIRIDENCAAPVDEASIHSRYNAIYESTKNTPFADNQMKRQEYTQSTILKLIQDEQKIALSLQLNKLFSPISASDISFSPYQLDLLASNDKFSPLVEFALQIATENKDEKIIASIDTLLQQLLHDANDYNKLPSQGNGQHHLNAMIDKAEHLLRETRKVSSSLTSSSSISSNRYSFNQPSKPVQTTDRDNAYDNDQSSNKKPS